MELGAVEHRPVLVARGPGQHRRGVRLDDPVVRDIAIDSDAKWLGEVDRIRRQEQRERLHGFS